MTSICNDCVKRFSCVFDAYTERETCGLYESDTSAIQFMIDCMTRYLDTKRYREMYDNECKGSDTAASDSAPL